MPVSDECFVFDTTYHESQSAALGPGSDDCNGLLSEVHVFQELQVITVNGDGKGLNW